MPEARREFTTEQLAGWVYDHEYDWGSEESELALPADTFPHYYEDSYRPTIAALCREVLELRELVVASAYVTHSLQGTTERIRQLDSNTRNADMLEQLKG